MSFDLLQSTLCNLPFPQARELLWRCWQGIFGHIISYVMIIKLQFYIKILSPFLETFLIACAYIFEPLFCRLIVFTTPYITNIWTDFSVGVLYCLLSPLSYLHNRASPSFFLRNQIPVWSWGHNNFLLRRNILRLKV